MVDEWWDSFKHVGRSGVLTAESTCMVLGGVELCVQFASVRQRYVMFGLQGESCHLLQTPYK